ncbi:MAG: type II CAAX endopeptidase family protein [Clostridium sp.]|nr:type II CAAX endopeptidase family protein [Clostridium sp.]
MRNKINFLKEQHIIILSILIAIVFLVVLNSLGLITILLIKSKGYLPQLIAECAGIIFSLGIIYLMGINYIFKERSKGILKGLYIGGFLIVMSIFAILGNLVNVLNTKKDLQLLPLPQIIIFIVTMIAIGVGEEFIFRGIILNLFIDKFDKTKKGIYISIALSSIIFGAAHVTNAFSGISIKSALIQAGLVSMLGALLAAIYLRSRNIWVVVIIHAFNDFSALIGSGLFGIGSIVTQVNSYGYIKLIGLVVYLIPILILLRKKKLSEILEYREFISSQSVNL